MGKKATSSKKSKAVGRKSTLGVKLPPRVKISITKGKQSNFGPLGCGTTQSVNKKKSSQMIVRRSRRLQSCTGGNRQMQAVYEEIHISESESEKEERENEKENGPPVVEESEPLEQTSDEAEKTSEKATPGVADIKYKSLYINSQKKIEALMEENLQLNKALELAMGKIDVYERHSQVYSEVTSVLASLARVNENLSAQMKYGTFEVDEEGGLKASKDKTAA